MLGWVRTRWMRVLAAAIWGTALLVLLYRLPYGVSHRDEAFYSAMPYSFLLGNRPYVDELAIHQNAGLLLMPLFRIYLAVNGSADGIILFNRYLYFAYIAVCSALAYRFARRLTGPFTGSMVAALVITFSYYNFLALSYNTCGAFGFFCGVLCTADAVRGPRAGTKLFGASLLFLSAMFSYPGLAPALLVYTGIVAAWLFLMCSPQARRHGLVGLGAGCAFALAVFAAFAGWLGRATFERLIAFSQSMGYASNNQLERLEYVRLHWPWRWILVGFAATFVAVPICVRVKRALWVVAALTVVSFAYWYRQSLTVAAPTPATLCLTAVPLLAPLCVALNRGWPSGRFLLTLVWAPSVLSMVCNMLSSAQHFQAASLGALGALVSGVVALAAYLRSLARRDRDRRFGYASVFVAVTGSLLVVQTHSLFVRLYDIDPTWTDHDTKVRSGPMRGAIATRHEAAFLEVIDHDLKGLEASAQSLTVFDNFATGYLSTRLRPRTFTQWIVWSISPAEAAAVVKETFGNPEKLPDLLLVLQVDPRGEPFWRPYFRDRYVPVIQRPEFGYVILRRER